MMFHDFLFCTGYFSDIGWRKYEEKHQKRLEMIYCGAELCPEDNVQSFDEDNFLNILHLAAFQLSASQCVFTKLAVLSKMKNKVSNRTM